LTTRLVTGADVRCGVLGSTVSLRWNDRPGHAFAGGRDVEGVNASYSHCYDGEASANPDVTLSLGTVLRLIHCYLPQKLAHAGRPMVPCDPP